MMSPDAFFAGCGMYRWKRCGALMRIQRERYAVFVCWLSCNVRALSDREPNVRLEAVRALEEMDGREAALLLRLKARMVDGEVSVTGQALASLLTIEREGAVPFVTEFLNYEGDAKDEDFDKAVKEEAALALGTSRLPSAVQTLIEYWQRTQRISDEGVLRGISASRQDAAIDFLLQLIREAREGDALMALDAMALHRDSSDIRARVEDAVGSRREPSISEQFRYRFPAV